MACKEVPQSYRVRIARLTRRVAELEAQLGVKHPPVRGRHPPASAALAHRCEECGSGPGYLCRTTNDSTRTTPHHVRGRTEPCGLPSCSTCFEFFVDVRAAE